MTKLDIILVYYSVYIFLIFCVTWVFSSHKVLLKREFFDGAPESLNHITL